MASEPVANGVMEPQTTTHQRVCYDFPGVGIWLPITGNGDACKAAGKNEWPMTAVADRKATKSIFQRMRAKVAAGSRRRRGGKVSPQSSSTTSTSGGGVQLTELEKQYLNYLRRSVGTGQFSHYPMPA